MYWKKQNRHSNTAIKVVKDANETIGHIPGRLSKVIASALKKEIVLSVEPEVTGHPRNAAEGKWTLRSGTEVLYIYRFYGSKINKAEFGNRLRK